MAPPYLFNITADLPRDKARRRPDHHTTNRNSFTTKVAKDTKDSEITFLNFVIFVSFVVKTVFSSLRASLLRKYFVTKFVGLLWIVIIHRVVLDRVHEIKRQRAAGCVSVS
jgi:hypothetical protein